ncbi:MAG: signal peptidase II [Deltaproteobacteria bacterium]|nr:signal peptidase II [Deltaproteobacteria bacterium]
MKWICANSLKSVRRLSLITLLLVAGGSVGLDQLTKIVAERELLLWSSPDDLREYRGKRVPVFAWGEYSYDRDNPTSYLEFNFTYVRNQGAAWGMFSEMEDSFRVPFFYVVTLLAFVIILLYLRATPLYHRTSRFGLVLVLSGAVGNFLDRFRLGYVIDFLDFRWVLPFPFPVNLSVDFFPSFLDFLNVSINANSWAYDFPKFNWADSMITTGVILLIFDTLVLDTIRKRQRATDKP